MGEHGACHHTVSSYLCVLILALYGRYLRVNTLEILIGAINIPKSK